MTSTRVRLKPDEYQILQEYRDRHKGLAAECDAVGIDIKDVKHYWYKGKHHSINVKGEGENNEAFRKWVLDTLAVNPAKYETIYYPKITDGHLLTVNPADVHLGKLCSAYETGDEYNISIAEQRLMDGVKGLLAKAQGFNIDRILLIIGNDMLHVDNAKSQTTAGTFQDTHLMWFDAFRFGVDIYKRVIELILPIAPVHVQYDPSNHDYTNGFFMAQILEALFKGCENITFNTSISHRKYFTYGENLIGTTHGDGAKEADLPMLMATEAPQDWANCKHRYMYVNHLHHKRSRDYMSVCVETLRSMSGTDSWHHRNGYQHAPKAIEGFIHHKQHGQIARITHLF